MQMPPRELLQEAVCEYVTDGDTAWFLVAEDGVEVTHKVRFLGIDSPETVHPDLPAQPGGQEASDYVKETLLGQTVYLEYDTQRVDRYGRQLCFIWMADGRLLNLELVLRGYARMLFIPPNSKYQSLFMLAQEQAKAASLGIWGLGEQVNE